MDSIDKWLKSLRLHKYTHLFKTLTYEEMLRIDEKYLIDLDITKGARNKILVSVKKLNLRPERLVNMVDDLDQGNISMKEALNVLKDMLITPIPHPYEESRPPSSVSYTIGTSESAFVTSPSSLATNSGGSSDEDDDNITRFSSSSTSATPTSDIISTTPVSGITSKLSNLFTRHDLETPMPNNLASYFEKVTSTSTNNAPKPQQQQYLSNPHELAYLFADTFMRLTQRLIESDGTEDGACHGIMLDIVDECLKHNSFTREQKAELACYRQRIMFEQKAKVARNKHQFQQQQQHHLMREQKAKSVGFKQPYQTSTLQHSYHQQSRLAHTYRHDHYYQQPQRYQQLQQQQQQQQQLQYQNSNSNHKHHYQSNQFHYPALQHQLLQRQSKLPQPLLTASYGEYSLLGPGKTFELPCLRAMAERSSRKS